MTLDAVGTPDATAQELFARDLPLALRYAQLLATVGVEHGLLGPREVPRLWERHLVNCALLARLIEPGRSVVDIGSGAGLPGIVLAIQRPDLRITLVESMQRRTAFLERAVGELGLESRVVVVRGRAEDRAVIAAVAPVDYVTARAVAPLGRLVGWSMPILRVGGELLAIKGESAIDEAANVPAARVETMRCGDAQTWVVRVMKGQR